MLLVGVKACHTVTQKLRVGHTFLVCPTDFLYLDVKKSVVLTLIKVRTTLQLPRYGATSHNAHQIRVELKLFLVTFSLEKK